MWLSFCLSQSKVFLTNYNTLPYKPFRTMHLILIYTAYPKIKGNVGNVGKRPASHARDGTVLSTLSLSLLFQTFSYHGNSG